jgi:hypothetical protein
VSSGVALAAGRGADVAAGCGDTGAAPAPLPQALSSNSSPSTRAKRVNRFFIGNYLFYRAKACGSMVFCRYKLLVCRFAGPGEPTNEQQKEVKYRCPIPDT